MMTKVCESCGKEYCYKGKNLCRTCKNLEWRAANPERQEINRRTNHARYEYNLTLEEYDALRMSPCGLCGVSDKPSVVDHNHATGKVRGPLCYRCNILVGYLETSSAELVDKAMTYIEEGD